MRERLIAAFVALAVGIIALYGIPRAYIVADLIETSETQRVVRLADFLAVLMEERDSVGDVTEDFLAPLLREGERITYTAPDGAVVSAGAAPAHDDIVSSAETPDGGIVEFSRSADVVSGRVEQAVMPVVVLGIVLMVASAFVAVLLARRLAQPFVRLAETARDMGHGGLRSTEDDLRIPEARAIDSALRSSADTLEQRIRREHEFAANASHQLRTPITALRLELEDLTLWPETPPSVREQLDHAIHEIDRLADAIAHLLQLARGGSPGTDDMRPLDEMILAAAERWSPHARRAGRQIVIANAPGALGTVPAPTTQILDVLIHNALTHGRGEVRLRGIPRAGYVAIQVSDEGPRPHGNAVFERRAEQRTATSGEGIGLALSAELAESLGGHLLLESAPHTTFSLILPVRERTDAPVTEQ
ncbi:HAMP domain-containing sensor histidine kinase [Microbacterium sp. ARD31]|uniref:sensor histidine kinase n=1 Tax=Microbacterium sp. ARD31 TaxID=2962576 RepID=UPI0028826936|nr:HAMP domain-containing sensor histidine kinase [Microbacterium sp. ARD31]MDT0184858.1 HAMP domain-containing sensor histidine kinase [Microbacterium sp. ARD31]